MNKTQTLDAPKTGRGEDAPLEQEITFEACGTFGALHKAEAWLAENGYSKGSLCRNEPVGLMKGNDWCIAKWKNLTAKERKSFDALLLPLFDFREGGCKIVFLKARLRAPKPSEAEGSDPLPPPLDNLETP